MGLDVEEEDEDADLAAVIDGSKHRDGSIYRPEVHHLHRLYHLPDTSETARLKPMSHGLPAGLYPLQTTLGLCHDANILSSSPSYHLEQQPVVPFSYTGSWLFVICWTLFRNYVFNRTRDNPYIIQDMNVDPFIYLFGPKRGIYMQCLVLIEYDIKIKRGEQEQDDLSLIDGVVTCCELSWISGLFTYRIKGDYGAEVDISRALLRGAVEATIEVWIIELTKHDGRNANLDLLISGFLPRITGESKLFRGIIDEPCELDRFVVAARKNSYLFIFFKVLGASYEVGKFAFKGAAHGCSFYRKELDFATVEVKVTWSALE